MIGRDGSETNDEAVGPVVESFLARFRRGERPALTELVARHPELAEQLQEIIPALVELERLGGANGSFSGSRAEGHATTDAKHPERLGDYRILRRIGGGGMGVVYEAEHESLKSRVALKVMHPRFRTDAKYLRRFHIEARSAAGLHHTNIVTVFDYGEEGGVCYYAMQYIQGQPLDSVLADLRRLRAAGPAPVPPGSHAPAGPMTPRSVAQGLMTGRYATGVSPTWAIAETEPIESNPADSSHPATGSSRGEPDVSPESPSFASSSLGGSIEGQYFREVARICAQVADALDYAHRAGVLHRDIKPPNLLLDALGNVWVTDFGLAKLEEGKDASQSQDLVGTLRFMAPERFRGISDRKGDIYALGATLYELLTLRPAFEGADQLRLIDRIIHEAPERPRLVDRNVPRDLETIVLKALAKDPKDRFGSAREMADELRQFVAGHPIRSRPITFVERFWRWCKRDPWLAGANVAAAALTTVLVIGALSTAYIYKNQVLALEEERNKTKAASFEAQEATLDARRRAVDAYIAQAEAGRFSHRPGQRFKSLEAIRQARGLLDGLGDDVARARGLDSLRDLAIAALALPDIRVARTFGKSPEDFGAVDIDPAFERYVVSDRSGASVLRRVETGAELFRFPKTGYQGEHSPTIDPRGRFLALVSGSRRLQLWRIDGPEPSLVLDESDGTALVGTLNFRDDGSALIFTAPQGRLVLLETETRRKRVFPLKEGKAIRAAFHPDGQRLAVVAQVGSKFVAQVRSLDDTGPTPSLDLASQVNGIAWSPDGRRMALACDDSTIRLWEPDRPNSRPMVLSGLNNGGIRISFNHRGDLLASQGFEGMLRLWDARTGRQLISVPTYAEPRFSADDRHVGIGVAGDSFLTFEVASGREIRTLPGDPAPNRLPHALSFEPAGRLLAVRTSQGLQLWDSEAAEQLADLAQLDWSLGRFDEDGSLLTFGMTGLVRWPMRRQAGRQELGPPQLLHEYQSRAGHFASSRDGKVQIMARPGESAIIRADDAHGRLKTLSPQKDVRSVALTLDGRLAASGSFHGPEAGVMVWDAKSGRLVANVKAPNRASIQFSPDGRWLATSYHSCKIWEVGTWQLAREIKVDSGAIDFSRDGSTLAICADNQVLLYNPVTGRRLASFEAPDQGHASVTAFSPDGSRLALVDEQDHDILVWDLRLVRSELSALGLDWEGGKSTGDEVGPPPPSPPGPLRLEVKGAGKAELARLPSKAQCEKFLQSLRRLFALRLDSAEEYYLRSQSWSKLKQWDAALADIERAVQGEKDNAFWNLLLSHFAYNVGEDSKSIRALERTLELQPNNAFALNSLAWALVSTAPASRDPDRALKLARRAFNSNPGNVNFRNTLVFALARSGLDAEAVVLVEKATNRTAWDDLAVASCYHRLGQAARAREAQASALKWRNSDKSMTAREQADFRSLADEVEAILSGVPGTPPR